MTRTGRRRFLAAVAGTTAVVNAGCDTGEDDISPTRFEPERVESILAEPAPDVERPAPVQSSSSAVEDGLARVDDLLSKVPDEVDPDRVPNGVVREDIERTRSQAVHARTAVADATNRFRALRETREARRYAREAAAALAGVDDERLADRVRDERDEVRATTRRRLDDVGYSGAAPLRTLLVAYRYESDLLAARRRIDESHLDDDPAILDVGRVAGDVEFARATSSVWAHLASRHADRADRRRDFEPRYVDALERTLAVARDADLPDDDAREEDFVERDVERRDVRYLLDDALRWVRRPEQVIEDELAAGRLARGHYRALRFERDRRAFETVVGRVEADEFPEPETVDRIREEREAALAAAQSVPVEPTEPTLSGHVLANVLLHLRRIDTSVQESVDRDEPVPLSHQYAGYAALRAQLDALPDAVAAYRDRFEAD